MMVLNWPSLRTVINRRVPGSLVSTGKACANIRALPLRVAIIDKQRDRVQYLDIRPNTPALYTFREIGSITVVPEPMAAGLLLPILASLVRRRRRRR